MRKLAHYSQKCRMSILTFHVQPYRTSCVRAVPFLCACIHVGGYYGTISRFFFWYVKRLLLSPILNGHYAVGLRNNMFNCK